MRTLRDAAMSVAPSLPPPVTALAAGQREAAKQIVAGVAGQIGKGR